MSGKKKAGMTELDALIASMPKNMSPDDVAGIVNQLEKRLIERALDGEIEEHLGQRRHAAEGYDGGNSRNGRPPKTVLISVPDVSVWPSAGDLAAAPCGETKHHFVITGSGSDYPNNAYTKTFYQPEMLDFEKVCGD